MLGGGSGPSRSVNWPDHERIAWPTCPTRSQQACRSNVVLSLRPVADVIGERILALDDGRRAEDLDAHAAPTIELRANGAIAAVGRETIQSEENIAIGLGERVHRRGSHVTEGHVREKRGLDVRRRRAGGRLVDRGFEGRGVRVRADSLRAARQEVVGVHCRSGHQML